MVLECLKDGRRLTSQELERHQHELVLWADQMFPFREKVRELLNNHNEKDEFVNDELPRKRI